MNASHSPSAERLAVLEKIQENERIGGERFFQDVEPDPPSHTLRPEDVDYPGKRFSTRLRRSLASGMIAVGTPYLQHRYRMELEGEENLQGITGGAVITSNHFSKWENLTADLVASRLSPRRRVYKIVREGNFFIPGFLGFLLKYGRTLPLSSSTQTMICLDRAITAHLQKGDCILIYPEQAMWWNYKKPRPYRIGAFRYAAKNQVPVIPCFVTLSDQAGAWEEGFPRQKYTVHIHPPLYPDPQKSVRDNTREMMERNAALCRETYERVYRTALSYACNGETAAR